MSHSLFVEVVMPQIKHHQYWLVILVLLLYCLLMYVLQYIAIVKEHSPYSIIDIGQVYLIAKFIVLVVRRVAGL